MTRRQFSGSRRPRCRGCRCRHCCRANRAGRSGRARPRPSRGTAPSSVTSASCAAAVPPSAAIIATVRSAQRQRAVDHQHPGAGARQQDGGRAAVADAIAGGAAAGDDGDLAGESPFVRQLAVRAHDSSGGPGGRMRAQRHRRARPEGRRLGKPRRGDHVAERTERRVHVRDGGPARRPAQRSRVLRPSTRPRPSTQRPVCASDTRTR